LEVPSQGIDQIVLSGDSGAVLAFAPGENMQAHRAGGGARIISGHRDTHFRFLQYVRPGTLVIVTDVDHVRHYRVSHKQIANASTDAINPAAMPGGLVLVTCYPFDALQAGGSERYLVFAHPIGTT
jgi:sortase A